MVKNYGASIMVELLSGMSGILSEQLFVPQMLHFWSSSLLKARKKSAEDGSSPWPPDAHVGPLRASSWLPDPGIRLLAAAIKRGSWRVQQQSLPFGLFPFLFMTFNQIF